MGFANREVRPIISKIIVYTAISQNVCQKIMNLKNWGILNFSRIPTWLMPASSFPLLCRLRWRENSEEKWGEGGRRNLMWQKKILLKFSSLPFFGDDRDGIEIRVAQRVFFWGNV